MDNGYEIKVMFMECCCNAKSCGRVVIDVHLIGALFRLV